MQKITLYFTCICLLFSTALINSCSSPEHVANKITITSGEIPPDMKTEDFTLIGILQGRKSYDKYVEKEFDGYTGKYVLATYDELKTKYKDVNKYRYMMDYDATRNSSYAPGAPGANGSGWTTTTNGYRYYILDRKENKKYKRRGESSFFALEMKAYLQAIQNTRDK